MTVPTIQYRMFMRTRPSQLAPDCVVNNVAVWFVPEGVFRAALTAEEHEMFESHGFQRAAGTDQEVEAHDELLAKLCGAFDDQYKCYEHRVLPTPVDGIVTRVHMWFM